MRAKSSRVYCTACQLGLMLLVFLSLAAAVPDPDSEVFSTKLYSEEDPDVGLYR